MTTTRWSRPSPSTAKSHIVTIAGAVGFGHLPAPALAAVTGLLPPGGLLALTAAPELGSAPALREHAGPA